MVQAPHFLVHSQPRLNTHPITEALAPLGPREEAEGAVGAVGVIRTSVLAVAMIAAVAAAVAVARAAEALPELQQPARVARLPLWRRTQPSLWTALSFVLDAAATAATAAMVALGVRADLLATAPQVAARTRGMVR